MDYRSSDSPRNKRSNMWNRQNYHSHMNPLRLAREVFYDTKSWVTDRHNVPRGYFPVHLEVTLVPAGSHRSSLRIEFVNFTGHHLPKARPRTANYVNPLMEVVYKVIDEMIDCHCCIGKDVRPITMHNVCWNDE